MAAADGFAKRGSVGRNCVEGGGVDWARKSPPGMEGKGGLC